MDSNLQFLLAVDGGGTKTDAVCAHLDGSVVSEGHAGPTNLTTTSVGAASFNLREALRQATVGIPDQAEYVRLVIGLAGVDSDSDRDHALSVFQPALADYRLPKIELFNDAYIALAGATSNPNAIVLLAGTGSNCFARRADGQTAKTGGMDYLLTDQGSGYAIGRRVLREAVKSYDGRVPKTSLEQLVCDQFQLTSIADIKQAVYDPPLSKIQVADLAKLCALAADQGDEVANRILTDAVEDLWLHVPAVIRRLEMESTPLDLVLAGSIYTIPKMLDGITKLAQESGWQINIVRSDQAPVYGALALARKAV